MKLNNEKNRFDKIQFKCVISSVTGISSSNPKRTQWTQTLLAVNDLTRKTAEGV